MSAHTPAVLDRFVPHPDARGRHEITVRAPAEFVLNIARNFDVQSIRTVRTLFLAARQAARCTNACCDAADRARFRNAGVGVDMLGRGGRPLLCCRSGLSALAGDRRLHVVFSAIAPEQFAAYAGSDQVKIAWTLEAEDLGPALTRFATETRVVATDDQARTKFRRYWRKFGIGIVMIRRVLLPVLRHQAERQWQANRSAAARCE